MKQLIEIEVDIPDGWKFVRFGNPVVGEWSLENGKPYLWDVEAPGCDCVVIEREAKYREPDSRDVGKPCEVMHSGIWQGCRVYIGRTSIGLFVTENSCSAVHAWQQARVIDDTPIVDVGKGYRSADKRDIGKPVEFSDHLKDWAKDGILISLKPNSVYDFEGESFNWKFARVRVS